MEPNPFLDNIFWIPFLRDVLFLILLFCASLFSERFLLAPLFFKVISISTTSILLGHFVGQIVFYWDFFFQAHCYSFYFISYGFWKYFLIRHGNVLTLFSETFLRVLLLDPTFLEHIFYHNFFWTFSYSEPSFFLMENFFLKFCFFHFYTHIV